MNAHSNIMIDPELHKKALKIHCPNEKCNAKPNEPCIDTVGFLRENGKGNLERVYPIKKGAKNTHPSRRKFILANQ